MIKLYGFGEFFGLEDASPFVVKVMAFMRLHNIDYELIADQRALGRAPKKKLPFIEHDGNIICDSTDIIDYLITTFNIEANAGLNDEQLATSQLLGKSLDEHFYWLVVYSRWYHQQGWDEFWPIIFAEVPSPLRKLLAGVVRRGVKKQLHAQGTARHSTEELLAQLSTALSSLDALLGDKRYFFGDQPTRFDATAYANICMFTLSELNSPFCDAAKRYPNLVEYAERCRQRFFA